MRPGVVVAAAVGAVTVGMAALFWPATRPAPAAAPGALRPAAQVVGRVEIESAAAPPAADTLVVYAFALHGPRLPLAVWTRSGTPALPLEFKLDDSLAPNPAYRLSQAVQLVVGARLGRGDGAAAQPGDWLATPQTVPLGAHGVRLVLRPPPAGAASGAAAKTAGTTRRVAD